MPPKSRIVKPIKTSRKVVPLETAGLAPSAAVDSTAGMTAWEKYQFASHKDRPRSLDFFRALFTEFSEISGDRGFRDDSAVICGLARFEGEPVAVIGQEMSRDVKERSRRNFGMMHPEGYRKALRVMMMASRFKIPIVILIDTKGAFPGAGAEERGQSEAIARNIRDMFKLEVPVIVTVIGAGASGGALGIGVGDRILMLEYSWYNVISPEGCAAILWNDPAMAPKAAEQLRLTAEDNLRLGVIDEIVPEPNGGAHLDEESAFASLAAALRRNLKELRKLPVEKLLQLRFEKFRKMGVYREL